ncbi:unnamed protein product [Effrenium voratum]|uniref:Uncharacterized protein n=1 Tax=Effrenium voratum TaxID=2562239 RepID=A0AA36HND1_9DINO|nr:unnamed protein product [Effrenium voratum]CAJ1461249.1 unnamed protein product [Effrenium voratum]
MSKGPRWAALAALATLSAWLSRLDVASLDSKMFGSGRPPNAQLIPGLLDRDAKRIKGAKWRQGPALMEEAKRKVDPAMPPLEDRVYVVTGATRGHGVHTAARLLDAGCTVILHGKDEGRLVDYALELGKAFPDGKIDTFLCDLREPDEVKALGHLIADGAIRKFTAFCTTLPRLTETSLGVGATPGMIAWRPPSRSMRWHHSS